ncbi:hypothetical protein JHK85_015355 [Glycine max]|nr:hypothetical protein JHK85_015355 [Glycine max]
MGTWFTNARPYLLKIRPKMTFRVFSEIMALAFFEIILDQCFALLGMKFTSASFLSAVMNSAPSVTFVMAVILRMEHMKIKEVACQAKVIGTVVTFGGTLLMALYKGPVLSFMRSSTSHASQPENVVTQTGNHWVIGTLFLLIGCAGFSAFYILQAITLRKYPAEMSLATWVCFVGALQSSIVAIFAERHHPHAWSLGWDTRLFAPAYAGIVTSGVQYYIQGMVSKIMGPVIVTAFNPLRMIIVTALACIILSEQLFLGSIIGAVVVVLGLYLVVWGKAKERRGMFIFAMDAIKKGMSHYVFTVYRNVIASVTLAPFAFVLERIILDQCFALLGMKFTSASFLSAVMNSAPSVTFLLAVILKLEHMKIKEVTCQAKVIGTVITFGGTLLMAIYKGPVLSVMRSSASHAGQPENVTNPSGNHWIIGTCFLLIGCAGFSAFYILQVITLRKYPAEMSLATWICFVGALQSSIVAVFVERHHLHAWALGWDTRLFAPAYAGIVSSGVQYYIQGVVIKLMGPVIVTAFNPLRMIIITTLACIVLSEQLYLGSIIGATVVVLGLYLVVWGKYKECHGRSMPPSSANDNPPEDQRQLPVTATRNDNKT